MTQIADALARAGYQDAEEWPSKALRVVVEKAMIDHANDSDAVKLAIFEACCPRNSLARALFAPWYREATGAVVAEIKRLMKAFEHADNLSNQQRRLSKIVALEEERAVATARAARQRLIEERGRAAAAREEEINDWLKNKARHEVIDGDYWWLSTPARIYAHARKTTHSAKFWNKVAEQLPVHDDTRPASDYLRPNEIDPIWDEAWGNENAN